MRFVVEALGLTAGGGKQLALDLFVQLARHREHEFVLLVPDLPEYPEVTAANLRRIACPKPPSLPARYHFLNRTVPRICVDERADALLCLGNFAPRRPPCPALVLFHNANMVYREPVAESRLTLREKLTRCYGRHALRAHSPQTRIIVQTPIMRQRLLDQCGFDTERVAVIPNSCFFPDAVTGSAAPAGLDRVKSEQAPIPQRGTFTFLCLTEYYAHKNLEILIEAMKTLPRCTRRPARCLITISPGQHPRGRKLLEQIDNQGLKGQLLNLGPVARERLGEVYGSADALILPTLLESFSRTYFEAMHFGLPVLTSDRDFARYICQDAALYFNPLDAGGVARSMATIMEDVDLRRRLVGNGRRVLRQSPTWEEIADRFVTVLERAATGWEAQTVKWALPHPYPLPSGGEGLSAGSGRWGFDVAQLPPSEVIARPPKPGR